MKFSEHHPKDVRTNNRGATYDIDEELSGAENKGMYFDSENGRVSSSRGNIGAWEKIRGQEEVHDTLYPGTWFCLVSSKINDDTFEIWVETTGADSPYIVINGTVMGKSDLMPWLYEHRVQFDVNENCLGGEIFLTDNNVSPIILNIKDIKDSYAAGDLTYFDDFNPELYYINLSSPLDIPVFTGLVNVGGGGGLPVGSYQYSIRYINEDGDFTNWSPLTPAIPVVQSLSTASSLYPSIKTYGGPQNISSITSYGVKLRFRITNLNNYDYVEIRRISYNFGTGIDYIPQGAIVAKLDVAPGEVSIREFIDPSDSNVEEETLADNEEAGELSVIDRAKGIRYYDKRLVLMNFSSPSKVAELDFLTYNGKKVFPVVEGLGKAGFNDPVAHAYKKNYPSNEKYSFAINLFDGFGGSGFTVEDDDLKNIQAPSRRDKMDQDSKDLSHNGYVTAAAVDSSVDAVFEVFDHEDAVEKKDLCSFKNIMEKGSKSSDLNNYCPDAGFGGVVQASEIGYQPYTPTDDNDGVSGHDYVVNPEVNDGSNWLEYRPKGFGCNYYSRGFAFAGIENFPSWAKSFSVVRTERAGRVVCQGIGMYSLTKGDFNSIGNSAAATKDLRKLWFTSPDIVSGLVNQATLEDMQANPQNYKVQVSSPLGFFSEVYNFENNTVFQQRDRLIDMVSYARVLRDNGQINPGEDPAMGVNGYVAFNKYRNPENAGQGAFNTPDGGNTIFGLSGFAFKSDGRSSYYEVEVDQNIYNHGNSGGTGDNDFEDSGMKEFTEPFYIINIIREGAEVSDSNINSYYNTGHYQKIESIIGLGDGVANQSFMLVDERWEDCIPSLTPTGFNNAGESFVYLVDEQQNERVCLNVTYYTPAQITTILTDISTNGFYTTAGGMEVHGIYTHYQDANGDIFIQFDHPFTTPSENEQVIVRYDSTRPIRVFGGDTVVGENVFCPIDKETDGVYTGTIDDGDHYDFNIGFPFRRFMMNPRHYVVVRTNGANKIQNEEDLRLGYLRQLIVMYACESISSSALSYNGEYPLEFFPLTHYVMRPNRWDDSSFGTGDLDVIADDNNMQRDYFDDYPEEYNFWKYGGFRFDQQYNVDYSVKGPRLYFSKPKVGFKEENNFCTGVAWSLPRAINQQNSPGLKTFLGTNRYMASDDNGEIKKAWDARTSGKGSNLYGVTESGICLFLTKKAILSNLSADDLTVTASDDFISGEYWISTGVGSNDEMWRGMADSDVEIRTESGRAKFRALFIPNSHSIYRLMENQVVDIAKDKYHARISPSLKAIGPGYTDHVTGHFDQNHNEYWLQMNDENQGVQRCFVYDQNESMFIGRFHYIFDKYLYKGGSMYGFKNGKMFELNKGYLIDGFPILGRLTQFTSVNPTQEKEAIHIEINTGPRGTMKPTEVLFLDEDLNILSRLNESLFGPRYLKQYDGWANQVPRKEAAVSADRDRIQYRVLLYQINHNEEEDFKVASSVIQYKTLK